ncbi:MAG: putative manganese transporter, partial [Bradymonadaceae bacterium]
VATLAATAGDSAFVILAVAPEAALWAYGMAFLGGVTFGYMIDTWGLGTARLDRAVQKIGGDDGDGMLATSSVAGKNPSISEEDLPDPPDPPKPPFAADRQESVSPMEAISHGVHLLWWVVAATGLFTISGLLGTTLSFFLYFVGRHYLGEGEARRVRESFGSAYATLRHAAVETSMVTVWVLAAYLLYEYAMVLFALDIRALAEAAGLLAPLAGVGLGLVPGCGPQIVFAGVYANGGIPFSALVGNAVSQDGDALFPLMAIDMKAAIIATIYTTVPATVISILVYYFWPFAEYGFGVMQ